MKRKVQNPTIIGNFDFAYFRVFVCLWCHRLLLVTAEEHLIVDGEVAPVRARAAAERPRASAGKGHINTKYTKSLINPNYK